MTNSTESGRPIGLRDSAWERDFNLLWTGSAISQIGTMNATLTAPLLALLLTNSPVFAGWVTAAGTLPRILLHLPVGVLVDRSDGHRVMIVSLVVRAALAILLTASVILFGGLPSLLLLAVAAQGVCLVFYNTAETTIIPRLIPNIHLPQAMAKNEGRIHAAGLLGRPLGGLLFDMSRWLPFAADALASSVSIFALLRMRKQEFKPSAERRPLRLATLTRELQAGLAFLSGDRFLRPVLIVCTLANFFFQTLGLLLVLLAHQQRLSSLAIGCLVASTALGGVLGSLTAPYLLRKVSPQRAVVMCVWSWLLLSFAVAVVDHNSSFYLLLVLPLAWGGIGYTGAHINVVLALYQAECVPKELLGRVTSASRFFSGSAVPLGALASGYIVAGLGTQGAAVLVAGAVAVGALILAISATPARATEQRPEFTT
ncbi:MFS transporter [Acrocarpospora pleiomorpha]|uniref:MFS transporter n=1 Tax=Acrocarpospora pleiomorpha TaxID=90975 RepID=UPI0012D32C07|nr:MFS transporter [Acrocarpospora pleiomorpha]